MTRVIIKTEQGTEVYLPYEVWEMNKKELKERYKIKEVIIE